MHHIIKIKREICNLFKYCRTFFEKRSEFENTLFVFRDDSVYGGEGNELVWVNEKSIARETFQSRKVVVRNYY